MQTCPRVGYCHICVSELYCRFQQSGARRASCRLWLRPFPMTWRRTAARLAVRAKQRCGIVAPLRVCLHYTLEPDAHVMQCSSTCLLGCDPGSILQETETTRSDRHSACYELSSPSHNTAWQAQLVRGRQCAVQSEPSPSMHSRSRSGSGTGNPTHPAMYRPQLRRNQARNALGPGSCSIRS